MTLDEIPPIFRRVWAVYSAFRRLGFTDDEVTYISAPAVVSIGAVGTATKEDYIHVVLTTQCRSFTVTVEPLDRPFEEAQAELEKLRLAMRDRLVNDDDMYRIWTDSKFGDLEYFLAFTSALMEHGFTLPALAKAHTN
jgi:hypothetical protein